MDEETSEKLVDVADAAPTTPPTHDDVFPSASTHEAENGSQGRKKAHQRSTTVVRVVDIMKNPEKTNVIPDDIMKNPENTHVIPDDIAAESNSARSTHEIAEPETYQVPSVEPQHTESPTSPPSLDAPSATLHTNELESSSGSSSTVIRSTHERRDGRIGREKKVKRSPSVKLDAMRYLDRDSPAITAETIRTSLENASSYQFPVSSVSTSPSSRSTTSSRRNHPYSDGLSEYAGHDTDRSTSPEQSPAGKGYSSRPGARLSRRHRSYGTPEMPRGPAEFPHISPIAFTSGVPGRGNGHIKHLPRAEKLPLTGYEQLASQLAGHGFDRSGPALRPIYRRFEMLNHRLLLHLQDELCELEEQLHRLDTADTQTRRLQNCILPASRRAEALSGGELQWHKTDILGKIGYKLEQYNRVLASFKATDSFQAPTMADIHEYRGYLSTHAIIAESETRFLDPSEDLICLSEASDPSGYEEDTAATPMPRRDSILFGGRSQSGAAQLGYFNAGDDVDASDRPSVPINLVLVIAVVVPTLTFSVIPGYLGRMVVAILVGVGVLGTLVQNRAIRMHASKDFYICAGAYGAIMAITAGVCR